MLVEADKEGGIGERFRIFSRIKKSKRNYRDNEGIYMNDISIVEIKKTILKNGL